MPLALIPDDELIDEIETAAECGVHKRTWYRWRRIGQTPPCVKLGRKRFYRRSAIKAWLLAREGSA